MSLKRAFEYHEKYGFSRTDSIVRTGKRIVIAGNAGTVDNVGSLVTSIALDRGGFAYVLTDIVRGLREITPRDSF